MSNREIANSILDTLTDEQINAFITLFADENIHAMIEADQIADDPERRHFDSFSEPETLNNHQPPKTHSAKPEKGSADFL